MVSWIATLVLASACCYCVLQCQAQGQCAETRKYFGQLNLAYAPPSNGGASNVCGRATCCSARDDAQLTKNARRAFDNDMRQVFSGSLYLLKRLSKQLDDALCATLHQSMTESSRVLRHTYKDHYERNKALFNEFFSKISFSAARPDCCHCEVEMESIIHSFLRGLVLVAFKEKAHVLSVSSEYETCLHRTLTPELLNQIFAANKVNWLLSRLKRQVCLPCHVRQSLRVARDFVHRSMTTQQSEECLAGIRCMSSCACCAGDANCTVQRPCFPCCKAAISMCVHGGGLSAAAPSFSWLMREVGQVAGETRDGKPDDVLKSLGVNLSEMIMEIYMKIDDTDAKISEYCGSIQQSSVATQVARAPFKRVHCAANSTLLHQALTEVESDSGTLARTFDNIPHKVCLTVSASPYSGCDECGDCQFRNGNRNDSSSGLLTELASGLPRYFRPASSIFPPGVRMPPFTCATPTTFAQRDGDVVQTPGPAHPARPAPGRDGGVPCDDEDNDCCQQGSGEGSGDGSGSGGDCAGSSGSGQGSGSGQEEITPSTVTNKAVRGTPETRKPPILITRAPVEETSPITVAVATTSGGSRGASIARALAFAIVLLAMGNAWP